MSAVSALTDVPRTPQRDLAAGAKGDSGPVASVTLAGSQTDFWMYLTLGAFLCVVSVIWVGSLILQWVTTSDPRLLLGILTGCGVFFIGDLMTAIALIRVRRRTIHLWAGGAQIATSKDDRTISLPSSDGLKVRSLFLRLTWAQFPSTVLPWTAVSVDVGPSRVKEQFISLGLAVSAKGIHWPLLFDRRLEGDVPANVLDLLATRGVSEGARLVVRASNTTALRELEPFGIPAPHGIGFVVKRPLSPPLSEGLATRLWSF